MIGFGPSGVAKLTRRAALGIGATLGLALFAPWSAQAAEPIKVGDLVMVVRPTACGHSTVDGAVFVVTSVGLWKVRCTACLAILPQQTVALGLRDMGIPVRRLIKIDPPALPESTPTKEELTA